MIPFKTLLKYYLSPLLEREGLDNVRAKMTAERLKNIIEIL